MCWEKRAILFLLALSFFSVFSFAQYNDTNQTAVCGNLVCESGESSSNCCMDCPSAGGGIAYGSWYCQDSLNKARVVTTTSYVCSNQTRAYEYVVVNSTEVQACGSGNVCSGGNCVANQTSPVCGDSVCEAGESSSNCCTDCPSGTGGGGAAYGSWYCRDAYTKARTVTTTTSVCSNQTKVYEYVTTNATEAQECSSGTVCSGGNCVSNQTSPVCGNGICESGESCASDCSGDYYVVSRDGLIEDMGSKWRLYDHDTEGEGPYYSNRFMAVKVVKSGVKKVSFSMGGSDWRRLNAFVSSDGVNWGDAVLPICCYGSGSYSFDAPAYSPFYVRFEMSSGSCCGASSYVTLDKALTLDSGTPINVTGVTCTDTDGGKDYSIAGSAQSSALGVDGRKDCCKNEYSTDMGDSVAHTGPGGGPCVDSGKYLYEAVCGTNGIPTSSVYECQNGCSNGACVPATNATLTCKDSDGGHVYDVAGTVSLLHVDGQSYYYEDKCVTPSTDSSSGYYFEYNGVRYKDLASCSGPDCYVGEATCDRATATSGATGVFEASACNNGCSGGACATKPSLVELSLATDKGSYSVGEEVKISAKTYTAGALVDGYVKGYVVRPDGGQDELVFAKEACVQPACPPGVFCAQVICPVQTGLQNAVYRPVQGGGYSVKVTASYLDSIAESSVKFSVGSKKKMSLYAWLESYDFKPGDKVKVLAKLTDSDGGPVIGADVYATVQWSGNVRPVYRGLVGIETVASKKVAVTAINQVKTTAASGISTITSVEAPAGPVMPTAYAVASIASSVEKQVSSAEAAEGISYDEYKKLKSVESTSKEIVVNYPGKIVPSNVVRLEYDSSTGYYVGYYTVPSDARSGTYKVAVSADFEGRHVREATSFSVGGEDYVSFENKARQSALEGKYEDCKDYYLKAAGKVAGDERRMLLDIEKAGICARLGGSSNVFYSDAGRIVENAAGESGERYVLLGVASQYYELGGNYARSRELLEKAAAGLEGMGDGFDDETSLLSNVIIAKYYSLLDKNSKASEYYKKAARSFAGKRSYGSDAFVSNLFAAKLYAKAGDLNSAREQYLIAAGQLSERTDGSSDSLISAFMAGDAYEKAGESKKAREQYGKAVGLSVPDVYGSSDVFFAYAAIGRSYERLGEKESSRSAYEKGLARLNSKEDTESSYFAAGLAGYLGDYEQAKKMCRKLFEQSLSEEGNIGKLTFMNAYCYSVLGDSVRAKKGCDLSAVTPQSETMILEYILEPLPPPVSYCTQYADTPSAPSCGNGVVDAGETPANCCSDTGCAFGDTCSKALNKCVKPVDEIPEETLLEVLVKLEDARMKLDALEGKALAISKYYGGKDQRRSDSWKNAANVFAAAKSRVDSITAELRANRGKISEDTLERVRQELDAVRASIRDAVDAILGVSSFSDRFDLDNFVAKYNKNLDNVPSLVKTLIGNERINARITLNNGSQVVFGGVTENGRIVEARAGGISNATMEIVASESAIREIISSKDRAKALQDALDSKRITYSGGMKLSVAERAYDLVSGLL